MGHERIRSASTVTLSSLRCQKLKNIGGNVGRGAKTVRRTKMKKKRVVVCQKRGNGKKWHAAKSKMPKTITAWMMA